MLSFEDTITDLFILLSTDICVDLVLAITNQAAISIFVDVFWCTYHAFFMGMYSGKEFLWVIVQCMLA